MKPIAWIVDAKKALQRIANRGHCVINRDGDSHRWPVATTRGEACSRPYPYDKPDDRGIRHIRINRYGDRRDCDHNGERDHFSRAGNGVQASANSHSGDYILHAEWRARAPSSTPRSDQVESMVRAPRLLI